MAPHPAFALDRRPGGLDLGGVPEAVDEDVRALLGEGPGHRKPYPLVDPVTTAAFEQTHRILLKVRFGLI